MGTMPAVGIAGQGFADFMAHLTAGDPKRAMVALERDCDAGWRGHRWLLRSNAAREPLWELRAVQAIMDEVETEMAGRLASLREMEWGGELVGIPRDDGSPQHGVRPR